jgi:N-formylmaleamate deformylase
MKRTSIWFFALLMLLAGPAFAKEKKYTAFQVTVTGHGRPVLLIPGATCGGDEWKETIAHFGDQYEFHVLTLAGYAGTPALSGGPYLETIKDQIEQYITDKKLNDVTLVGHSIGGFLSIWIASDMKTNLRNVLVVDGMPFFAGARNPAAADTFNEADAKAMLDRYNQMDDNTFKTSQRGVAKFMCADSTRWDLIVKWGAMSDKKTMAYTMTEMLGKDLRKKIADIKVPVVVLAAYASMPEYPMYTRETVSAVYAAQYKACTTCMVHVAEGGTRHFIMYDNPTWFYKEMNDILSAK